MNAALEYVLFGSTVIPPCPCQCPKGPCAHKFDGPVVKYDTEHNDELAWCTTCSKCGMLSVDHFIWLY